LEEAMFKSEKNRGLQALLTPPVRTWTSLALVAMPCACGDEIVTAMLSFGTGLFA
jgi:hypothetical protein